MKIILLDVIDVLLLNINAQQPIAVLVTARAVRDPE